MSLKIEPRTVCVSEVQAVSHVSFVGRLCLPVSRHIVVLHWHPKAFSGILSTYFLLVVVVWFRTDIIVVVIVLSLSRCSTWSSSLLSPSPHSPISTPLFVYARLSRPTAHYVNTLVCFSKQCTSEMSRTLQTSTVYFSHVSYLF